eukprot:Opistho-2@61361
MHNGTTVRVLSPISQQCTSAFLYYGTIRILNVVAKDVIQRNGTACGSAPTGSPEEVKAREGDERDERDPVGRNGMDNGEVVFKNHAMCTNRKIRTMDNQIGGVSE